MANSLKSEIEYLFRQVWCAGRDGVGYLKEWNKLGDLLKDQTNATDWYKDEATGSYVVDWDANPKRQLSIMLKPDGKVAYAIYADGKRFHGPDAMIPDFFVGLRELTARVPNISFGPDASGGFYVSSPDGQYFYARPQKMMSPQEFTDSLKKQHTCDFKDGLDDCMACASDADKDVCDSRTPSPNDWIYAVLSCVSGISDADLRRIEIEAWRISGIEERRFSWEGKQ